jgi:hypothetical protein
MSSLTERWRQTRSLIAHCFRFSIHWVLHWFVLAEQVSFEVSRAQQRSYRTLGSLVVSCTRIL